MTPADERAAKLAEAIQRKRSSRRRGAEIPPRPEHEPAHLGAMQRSLWLAHRLEPQSATYHLVDAYRMSSAVDLDRLEESLRQVVQRHRLLRSTFRSTPSGGQQIPDSVPVEAFVIEYPEVSGQAEDVAVREARRPFDMGRGPLLRLLVVHDLLVLALHHILADEQSLIVFWQELAAAYSGRLEESPPRIQYDDYVAWSNRDLSGRSDTLDFWRRRLTPPADVLRLPFEVSRDREPEGRLLTLPLASETAVAVRQLASSTGTTPFVVYAFAYRVLINRLLDGPEPAIATPVSTRSHTATAKMFGYFTNPVLLPSESYEDLSLGDALHHFGQATREALARCQVAFADLVDALDPPRNHDRHPVFQTMFVFRQPGEPPTLGDIRLEPVSLDLRVSKFDLTLFVTEGDRPSLSVEFRADRLDEVGVRRLMALYDTLLVAVAEGDVDQPVATLSMVSPSESERLEAYEQGPTLNLPVRGLATQLRDVAANNPDSPAVVCGGEGLDYASLIAQAGSIATGLRSAGVSEGDRVALYLERSVTLIASVVGSLQMGATYVPLDPTYPEARNRDVLQDAQVSAVLTSSRLEPSIPTGSWTSIRTDELRAAPGESSATTLDDTQSFPRSTTPAYLLYTSGSTGRPKGVVVSHDNLSRSNAARVQLYDTTYGVRPRRFLLLPSIAFDSSVAGLFWTLSVGGTLVLPTDDEARDPRVLLELMGREKVDSLLCVPSLYAQILQLDGTAPTSSLNGLKVVIVAGESCPWSLVAEHFRRLPETRLFNEYGPTETTVWASLGEITSKDLDAYSALQPVSIGRPIPGVCIELEDSRGRRVPLGIPGAAWVEGGTVSDGYWQRPDLTAERFEPGETHRRYQTGDRMRWSEEGRLLFLGRVDEQIKLRGVRIEPGEIESHLLDWPEIRAAAVVIQGEGTGRDRLVAFVEGTVPETWRHRLATVLPQGMVPSSMASLAALPRQPNGKVDRRALEDLSTDEPRKDTGPRDDSVSEGEVPTTTQLALLSLWRGLLGISRVGLDDNFFELGGHSLLVAEMTLAIEEDFGVQVAASDVFQSPTVRQLARQLQDGGNCVPYEHLFPLQTSGPGAPFVVAIPHFFADLFANRFRGLRPVYGLRGVSLRIEGNQGRWASLAELAEELADEVCHRFPDETESGSGRGIYLAGYSFGASMAAETAHVLETRGVTVRGLYLVTPMALNHYSLGPLRLKIRGLERPVDELTTGEAMRGVLRDHNPFTIRPYRYAWRWLLVQPRRRFLCGLGRIRQALGLPLTSTILHADVRAERFRMHKAFRPRSVHAPTVVFNANENALEPGTDAAATWRGRFLGPLEVVPIPDPHLDDASVEATRRILYDRLPLEESSR